MRRTRYLFQHLKCAPYIEGMNTKTDIAREALGKEKNKSITFYKDAEKIVFHKKPKKPYLSAKALGGDLTSIAVRIAAKNQTIKGTADYKKVDKALIHLCEAIKALKD